MGWEMIYIQLICGVHTSELGEQWTWKECCYEHILSELPPCKDHYVRCEFSCTHQTIHR